MVACLAIVATGIFMTNCESEVKEKKFSTKTMIMWSVDPLSEISHDSISYDGLGIQCDRLPGRV